MRSLTNFIAKIRHTNRERLLAQQSARLDNLVVSLKTDMERVSGVFPFQAGAAQTLDHFLGRDCCEYCRSNPGKSETCKNCGAPTTFDAEYQWMMLTPPILYNPARVDVSRISNKPHDLIPIYR